MSNFINCVLDKQNVQPGEQITGKVFVGSYVPANASLKISVWGQEECKFQFTMSVLETEKHLYDKYGNKNGAGNKAGGSNININGNFNSSFGGMNNRPSHGQPQGQQNSFGDNVGVQVQQQNNFGGNPQGVQMQNQQNRPAHGVNPQPQVQVQQQQPSFGDSVNRPAHGNTGGHAHVHGQAQERPQTVNITCIAENSYNIFNENIDLSKGPLGQGEFTFPFQFQVPAGAPASFNYQKSGDEYAKISYKVTATYGPVSDTEHLIVQQNVPDAYKLSHVATNNKVTCYCCIPK